MSHFKLKTVTTFHELREHNRKGKDLIIGESDLCFQDDECIYQFEYINEDKEGAIKIKPGLFSLTETNAGLIPSSIDMKSQRILKSVTNTKKIVAEADSFFNNLHVYDELGEQKARKLLLYSDPGLGKTSTIREYCLQATKQDEGTVVLVWPTTNIEAYQVLDFLSKYVEYEKECTRLILVMEDIGGGEREGHGGSRSVDSALLDILDGINLTFKLPTLIIATTNYPQNLLSALADRPGRFDLMMKLDHPSKDERVEIVEFIARRELTEDEKKAVRKDKADDFSIAHWKEVVIRSAIHQKTLSQCIEELIDHKAKFSNNFEDKSEVGFL